MTGTEMTGTDAGGAIAAGRASLGIELGSTRIKAVLVDEACGVLATADHAWENAYRDGVWTYDLADVWAGLQDCFARLTDQVRRTYGVELTRLASMGVSAMMHGYLAEDADGELLVPFRTWRNTTTAEASRVLTAELGQHLPQRWSASHLYQAVLDGEEHLPRLHRLHTLAGLVHERLTGEHVLGIGDASGMFPIDDATGEYDRVMAARFDGLATRHGFTTPVLGLLPRVLRAGQDAGRLTAEGARLLDPTGRLEPGVQLCPPEGDAGTGMVATNSIAPRSGNVSAGTSIFAMVVLEQPLAAVHPEIDLVTTPDGHPVAMVHTNNGTSDLNAWLGVFGELASLLGHPVEPGALFELVFGEALRGDPDGGGLLAYNYVSGEHITAVESGRPLLVRTPDSRLTLANLVRTHLMSAFGTLRIGMDILAEERVRLERLYAHGGLFKTAGVAQSILAGALDTPVAVGSNAGEGGAWGIATLAAFLVHRRPDETLAEFLDERVFADAEQVVVEPDPVVREGFERFMAAYRRGLVIEQTASQRC